MKDIVIQLREWNGPLVRGKKIRNNAADEIERLRAALERFGRADLVLDAIDEIPEDPDDPLIEEHVLAYDFLKHLAREIAREAMKQ